MSAQLATATNETAPAFDERAAILAALDRWIRQRPGLEFCNYGDVSAYRSELRGITRDGREARTLLDAVRWRTGITADRLRDAFRAFSGRLSWDSERRALSYCDGQYWPTEYRRAACAVLASALWDYARDQCMPEPSAWRREYRVDAGRYESEFYPNPQSARAAADADKRTLSVREVYGPARVAADDYLRASFRREYGRGIASRWFN